MEYQGSHLSPLHSLLWLHLLSLSTQHSLVLLFAVYIRGLKEPSVSRESPTHTLGETHLTSPTHAWICSTGQVPRAETGSCPGPCVHRSFAKIQAPLLPSYQESRQQDNPFLPCEGCFEG